MELLLGAAAVVLLCLFLVFLIKAQRLQSDVARSARRIAALTQENAHNLEMFEADKAQIRGNAQASISEAEKLVDAQIVDLKQQSERVRAHYESEARKIQLAADEGLSQAKKELAALKKYESLIVSEDEVRRQLEAAIQEATAVRREANSLLEESRRAGADERSKLSQRAKELHAESEARLSRATKEAGRIVEDAHRRAKEIAGDAYTALRERDSLDQAVKAIRNVVEGYGDRYVIPTRSLLDDLSSDFGHTEAGESLRLAREHSRRMVEQGQAADCAYAEANRRETAIRFVVDAFNGRVDAILSRVRHDNVGTLEQEIRDAFALVNLNGKAFRDAKVLTDYLESRLSELKWAVVVQELKLKEREEQRRIQEQIREEEKVRRELERAIKDAEDEEAAIRKAMEKARQEVAEANAGERAKLEKQLAELSLRLVEAEAKEQRALSMAQQTRSGNVYIISNIGAFGEDVFKIGMTRRLEPLDRIKELSDASVPFEFDVHAMIKTDDAPKLENDLHTAFEGSRMNMVNYRKEFFRIPLDKLRAFVAQRGETVSFTMVADAHEYRESLAIKRMTPEEREIYRLRIRERIEEKV